MVKRILAFALASLMLFAAIPASAAQEDFGPWEFSNNGTHTRVSLTDPDVTETGKCEFEATRVYATCLYVGFDVYTCAVCKYSYKDNYDKAVGAHDFTGWMTNNDATFRDDGTETRTCKVCGETETRAEDGSSYLNLLLGEFDFKILLEGVKSAGGWLVTIVKMIINTVKGLTG